MQTDQEFSSVVALPGMPGASVVTRRNASEDPDQATAETIGRMKELAAGDSSTPQVMRATQQALLLAGPADADQSAAIYRWITSHCRFREDDPVLRIVLGLENELEMLIAPARLLTMRQPAGDCDCLTTLCMSMHLCAGLPVEPITIKADPDEPWRDSHVYCQAALSDGNLVLDVAQGCKHNLPCGWEAPEYFSKKEWGVVYPDRKKGLQGLGTCDFSGSGEDCTSSDVMTGPLPGRIGAGAAFDWGSIINNSFRLASQLALKPGQYVQTSQGVMANQVPGAVPGGYNFGVSGGGIGTGTIVLAAGALALVLALGRK